MEQAACGWIASMNMKGAEATALPGISWHAWHKIAENEHFLATAGNIARICNEHRGINGLTCKLRSLQAACKHALPQKNQVQAAEAQSGRYASQLAPPHASKNQIEAMKLINSSYILQGAARPGSLLKPWQAKDILKAIGAPLTEA